MATSSPILPGDQRVVLAGIPLALVAVVVFFLGQADTISEHTSAVVTLALGAILLGLCLPQWARGARLARERIPVIAPVLFAGGPAARSLGILTSNGVGVAASIVFGVFAALILGVAMRRR